MPYLTAAHARRGWGAGQGGRGHRGVLGPYEQKGLGPTKSFKKGLNQQTDIYDIMSISEHRVFTLLTVQ